MKTLPIVLQHRTRALVSSLLVCLACLLIAAPARCEDEIFLWQVRSDTATAYILGSIHLAKPDLYPLDKRIEDAFRKAERLVVEIDSTTVSEEEATRLFLERGMYAPGESLQDNLSPRTVEKLKGMGVNIEQVDRMKPWFLATWLQAQLLQELGFDESLGIDLYFLKKAHAMAMPVIELESFDSQLAMFERLSDGYDDDYLFYSLDEMSRTAEMTDGIVQAWKNGDTGALERIIIEPYRTLPVHETFLRVLFFERNQAMTAQIENLLSDGSTSFVVVGAGHMVGEQGMINLLRRRGYSINQM